MIDILISGSANDVQIINGDLALCTGSSAIAQGVLQRLQMFLGEWFLDNTKGIPWLQTILVKNPNFDVISSIILDCITGSPGVTEIQSFNLSYTNSIRQLSISFSAKCSTGDNITVNTQVGV